MVGIGGQDVFLHMYLLLSYTLCKQMKVGQNWNFDGFIYESKISRSGARSPTERPLARPRARAVSVFSGAERERARRTSERASERASASVLPSLINDDNNNLLNPKECNAIN